ncbi:MAG: hypothetical protein KJ630_04180 [Proteobacteria bacterium]|nr:hypothetical protein [Pseudomonadota bacterium]
MRRDTRFRLYFNNEPATRDQLEQVDTITVEQEIGMAWEAQLTIPICVDRRGYWRHTDEPFMQPFGRVRVEIAVRGDRFVPLIDGPIVNLTSQMHFEAGRSTVTVTVRDDSVYLNKDEQHFTFDPESDYQIITTILTKPEQIERAEIDPAVDQTNQDGTPFRANGTAMDVLTNLAKNYDAYIYILPGEQPGRSIGYCKTLPDFYTQDVEPLPTMMLLGPEANILELNEQQDFQQPGEYSGSTLRISDKRVLPSSASYRDRSPMGDLGALPEGQVSAVRLLRPNPFEDRNRARSTAARASRSSFAFLARGSVIAGCYPDILQPYRVVAVKAGGTPLSGDYIVKQVTHTLGRSSYEQSFTLMRNAETETRTELRAHPAENIS